MASIKRTLSAKTDQTGKAEILLRLSISKNNKQRIKSGIFVTASRFREGEFIKPRANQKELQELNKIEATLQELERFIISLCQDNDPDTLTKDFFLKSIENHRHPEKLKNPIREIFLKPLTNI